jgi:hypothetical protein
MIIKKFVTFENEIEIDLSADDLRGFLEDINGDDKENKYIVGREISKAVMLLQNVPEKFRSNWKDIVIDNLNKALKFWQGD